MKLYWCNKSRQHNSGSDLGDGGKQCENVQDDVMTKLIPTLSRQSFLKLKMEGTEL